MFIVILLLLPLTTVCEPHFLEDISPEREARARLYDDLAAHRVLTNKLSPLCMDSEVVVDFEFDIPKVIEAVEAKQTVEILTFLSMRWQDRNLAWSTEHYGNVSKVKLPTPSIWRPFLFVSNTVSQGLDVVQEPAYVDLVSDGNLTLYTVDLMTANCNFDLTYYPFDKQSCPVILLLESTEVAIKPHLERVGIDEAAASMKLLRMQNEWEITNVSVVFTGADSEGFRFITLTVDMKRAWLYYVLCVLTPMTVTSMLTLLVFWIPPESGEKMSFVVSLYVSTSLFLNFVGDTLPRNMGTTNTPRMTQFLTFVIMEGAMVMVATVLVLCKYQQEMKTPSETPLHTDLFLEKDAEHIRNGDSEDPETKEKLRAQVLVGKSLKLAGTEAKDPITTASAVLKSLPASSKLDAWFFWIFATVCIVFFTLVFLI